MGIFHAMESDAFEQIVFCRDRSSGLQAIIAIHDTTLGPALGGVRMRPYESEDAAIEDAMRLARGMTYKNALAGLNLGGGKAVIIGDSAKDKSEALFRAFGRFVNSLGGRYITAEDVGTTENDMDLVFQETKFVTGISPAHGSSGNPAPATAFGVYQGMRAAAKFKFGVDHLSRMTVAVLGLGQVGWNLCRLLHEAGVKLIVSDIRQDAVDEAIVRFGAVPTEVDRIYGADCDIFSPCALGAVLHDDTIPLLKARIVAGAANNQLLAPEHGERLQNCGILYAPDYAVNSGGVIHIADELNGYNRDRAYAKIEGIYQTLTAIFEMAEQERMPTSVAADRLAEERIRRGGNLRQGFWSGGRHAGIGGV